MEKERTLMGEKFAGNLQGDDFEGLSALKGRVQEYSECVSACPKMRRECSLKILCIQEKPDKHTPA